MSIVKPRKMAMITNNVTAIRRILAFAPTIIFVNLDLALRDFTYITKFFTNVDIESNEYFVRRFGRS